MTLTTRIRIIEPYHAQAVMDEACRIIGAREPVQSHGPAAYMDDGRWEIRNAPGQGYPALVWLYYGVDAPLMAYGDESGPQEFAIELCLDTEYGYHADNVAGCHDLHAWIIRELAPWFDGIGLRWAWCDEFKGEWFWGNRHDTSQAIDGLAGFGDPDKGALAEGALA
jgi:hypothetical protein